MAAEIRPVDEQTTQGTSKESLTQNELFVPEDTLDQPCDVVLVVEDGKEFKAHRQVLSKASTFFQKLLNSDMKESNEGVVQLEMFSESVMAATLEFIYTGHVQILAEGNARDLIVMADYLILQNLKLLVEGVLAQKLNTSNCISTYYFSERYQCQELLSETKTFILVNFSAVYAANREDVLNMSSKEAEMWISSDEIDVSAEEDVFKFILAWIAHDKSKRKKYFAEFSMQLPSYLEENSALLEIFVSNEDNMYALVSKRSTDQTLTVILEYKPASNSWEHISSLDSFELRCDVCIVAKDNFIYFIGGTKNARPFCGHKKSESDVDRYDFSKKLWDKVADVQIPRERAHGAAANGKIFIAGGDCNGDRLPRNVQCEVYDETLNEWQFIKCFNLRPEALRNIVSFDDKLYAVGFMICDAWRNCELRHTRVECYNSEKDEWEIKSEIATVPTRILRDSRKMQKFVH
ncbi:hypothetical protein ACROYT_G037011 [Oculina patagonica]